MFLMNRKISNSKPSADSPEEFYILRNPLISTVFGPMKFDLESTLHRIEYELVEQFKEVADNLNNVR